ncbi:head-tail joining protein [Pseudomonas sp. EL_65y_Pfl1_R83]|uniref:head-tail joining protein n=1 Tax=Pseudomonas sp. EL_65y_Pfl1_R83 TaxID=3088697 RepID=UPI0030D7A2D1
MAFRDLIDDIDDVVFETLGDSAQIEGRAEPVLGMFMAPWKAPQFGKTQTAIREPRFEIRVRDSDGLSKGLRVTVDVPALDGGGEYDLLQLEPSGDGLVALILRKRA